MNLRNLCNRILSSMLALGMVGSLMGLGEHSVSAQSITATTPFSFCVNNQAYPSGRYRFTLVSLWLLSIRNVDGGSGSLFQVYPEDDGAQGLAGSPAGAVSGVTFRTVHGFRKLEAVHEAGTDVTFELMGQRIPRDKSKTHRPLQPINCLVEGASIHGRNAKAQ